MDLLDKIIPVTKIIKILDYQMESADLEFLFQRKNTKFVLLERYNKLEQFVSHETSKKIDKWINADTSNVKIHVDRTEFTNFVNKSTAWYEKIRTRLASEGHNFLEINYERDLNHENLDPVVLKVKDWLATQSIDTDFRYTDIQYKKQNLSPMSEKISNFDEISDIFDTLSNSS
jgi:LPS sulfotransferase NodH